MTDRELLELAAKAAGYWFEFESMECAKTPGSHFEKWNPLEDDGDALRLAVVLRLDIRHWDGPIRMSAEHPSLAENSIMQETMGGPMWAVRRVIVRAAAEIGKSMTTGANHD